MSSVLHLIFNHSLLII